MGFRIGCRVSVPDCDYRPERRRARISRRQKLDREYQAAVADYEAGRYAQAADELQHLLPYAPKSYELHELLGMVYVALGEGDNAIDQLKNAVQIRQTWPKPG